MTKVTQKERAEFALSKASNAFKWIVISGVLTFALNEAAKLLSKQGEVLTFRDYIPLILSSIINILIFAVGKYVEGQEKKS
jgi:hypothetical protein